MSISESTFKEFEPITSYEINQINTLMSNYSLSLEQCTTWLKSHRDYFNGEFHIAADQGEA